MKRSDIPSETFPIPFAADAGGGYIRQIPVSSQIGIINGAASLEDGFPPLNFLPVGSGGVPPFGQDMNGILNGITQWTQWQESGGLAQYNSGFSTAIGGYPKGALLSGTGTGAVWLNTVDDNTSNPDSAGTGWVLIATSTAVQNSQYTWAGTFGGTANALTATLTPAPTAYTAGLSFKGKIATSNTGATTVNVNGLGVQAVLNNGAACVGGELVAGTIANFTYDGTNVHIDGGSQKGQLLNTQVFKNPGTSTYTPTPGTTYIEVEVQGGGGAAGGTPATGASQLSLAGGGGSGAWSQKLITSGFAGVTITVGAGGVGVSGGNGGNGGTSSFGSLLTAGGGGGGNTAGPSSNSTNFNTSGGTAGATPSLGDINAAGIPGLGLLMVSGTGTQGAISPSRFGGGPGAGGQGGSSPPNTPAAVGPAGQPGIVIIREYA